MTPCISYIWLSISKVYIPVSEATKPLRELLSPKNQWLWSDTQQQAFEAVRIMVSSNSIFVLFDPHRQT